LLFGIIDNLGFVVVGKNYDPCAGEDKEHVQKETYYSYKPQGHVEAKCSFFLFLLDLLGVYQPPIFLLH